jgi:hypothetical protein
MPPPRCPNCAAELPPDARTGGWCEACGKPLPHFIFKHDVPPEPDGPKLPVDDSPFQYRYPVPLILGGMFAACVGFVVAYPFGLKARVIAGIVAGVVLVVGVTVLVVNATLIPRLNRDLLALQSGECLAKWEYSTAEWLRFVEADWRRGQRWAGVLVCGLMVTVGAVLLLPRNTAGDREIVAVAACGGAAIVLTGGALFGSAWATYRRRRSKVGVAFIGHGLAVAGGRCAMWGRSGWKLNAVRVADGNPAVLEIVLDGAENSTTFRVPIPRGREGEARRLTSTLMHGA